MTDITNEYRATRDGVAAVVVTFNPDLGRLRALLNATLPQVKRIYVVDNGSYSAVRSDVEACPGAAFLPLGRNLGLAAAQNVGASAAIAGGAAFVLLLDQDSIPAHGMVAALLGAHHAMAGHRYRAAAVGPRVMGRGGPSPFVKFDWFRYSTVEPLVDQRWVSCDFLIASGMLIPSEAWQHIGPMDETLFIDKVDTDWCLRAASLGYVLAGVPSAVLEHRLGERSLKILSRKGWTHIDAHHPFRYYYIFRNGILLLRRPYATWRWRTADLEAGLRIFVLFVLFSPARWSKLRMMLMGVFDGLRSKTGPLGSTLRRK